MVKNIQHRPGPLGSNMCLWVGYLTCRIFIRQNSTWKRAKNEKRGNILLHYLSQSKYIMLCIQCKLTVYISVSMCCKLLHIVRVFCREWCTLKSKAYTLLKKFKSHGMFVCLYVCFKFYVLSSAFNFNFVFLSVFIIIFTPQKCAWLAYCSLDGV